MQILTYLGCYTDERRQAIHILASDSETGALTWLDSVTGIENAIYLTLNRAATRLYAGLGLPQFGARAVNGSVAVFAVKGTGLELLNFKHLGVTPPCHVRLDAAERHLLFAEYTNALAGVAHLDDDGALLDAPLNTVQHTGRGHDPERQDSAHTHYITTTPAGDHLCVVDLGLDRVKVYDFINRAQGLREQPALTFASAAGAGPRHLRFHPNGRRAFLLHELDNTLSVLSHRDGQFACLDTLSTLPADFRGFSKAAALKFTPDGRICVSNRGHDSLVTFNCDLASGALELCAFSPLAGESPRDFEFMPGGKFAVVAHESSHHIMSYAYNAAAGSFTPLDNPIEMFRPVCVKFGAPLAQ